MPPVTTRSARDADADALCAIINPLIEAGGTTAHKTPFTPERMVAHYIAPPFLLSCVVAETDTRVLGFQSLVRPDPDYTGENGLDQSWGVIASFVASDAQGLGVGQALFAATREIAVAAGLMAIDATIRPENTAGHRYYGGLGFTPYGERYGAICRRYDL